MIEAVFPIDMLGALSLNALEPRLYSIVYRIEPTNWNSENLHFLNCKMLRGYSSTVSLQDDFYEPGS